MVVELIAAWAILFVGIYSLSESAQRFFYDQVVDGLWWRAAVVAAPLGAVLVRFPSQLDEMFTTSLHWTILQAVLWWLAFRFVLMFQSAHAALVGIVGYLLLSWAASMAARSLHQWVQPS